MKNTAETPEADNKDSGVLSNPLSFLRSGVFDWNSAGLVHRGGVGFYWSLRSYSTTYTYDLYFRGPSLAPQDGTERGDGFAVRCDKSFTTLINTSYSMKNQGQTEENNRDAGLLSNPLSFLRSGRFVWDIAIPSGYDTYGTYWSPRSYSTIFSSSLFFYTTYLNPQSNDARGQGFTVHYELHSLFLNS